MSKRKPTATANPGSDTPEWFWEIIAQGQQNQQRFMKNCEKLSQRRLSEFIVVYRTLISYFKSPPFTQHLMLEATWCSEDTLDDVARLLISQGKVAFDAVWNHPEEFGKVVKAWVDNPSPSKVDKSYGFVAESVWRERFGDELPEA